MYKADVSSMLVQPIRRWSNITPALGPICSTYRVCCANSQYTLCYGNVGSKWIKIITKQIGIQVDKCFTVRLLR